MSMCQWKAVGKLSAVKVTPRGRKSYATVRLESEEGELVYFAHDETLIKDLIRIKLQDEICLNGIVEPRDPKIASNRPYFLNILYFERLQNLAVRWDAFPESLNMHVECDQQFVK